jgi:hypothetical protein
MLVFSIMVNPDTLALRLSRSCFNYLTQELLRCAAPQQNVSHEESRRPKVKLICSFRGSACFWELNEHKRAVKIPSWLSKTHTRVTTFREQVTFPASPYTDQLTRGLESTSNRRVALGYGNDAHISTYIAAGSYVSGITSTCVFSRPTPLERGGLHWSQLSWYVF